MKNELLSAALDYAAKGYAVFPCRPEGKAPLGHLVPGGFRDASSDPVKIRQWWKQAPAANIGLALRQSGLVAIDPDTYKEGCGWDAFIADKQLPDTWQQGARGRHIIFTAPPEHDFPDKVARYVDIVWDSPAYIVAAPSVFRDADGGLHPYRRLTEFEPAPAPDWLLDAEAYFDSKEGGGGSRLEYTRDAVSGLVVDGRGAFLSRCVIDALSQDWQQADVRVLAAAAWERFKDEADLSSPKSGAAGVWSIRDATARARWAVRRRDAGTLSPRADDSSRLIDGAVPDPLPTEPVDAATAKQQLREAVAHFFDRIWQGEVGFQTALLGTPGLGKSEEVLTKLAEFANRQREVEDVFDLPPQLLHNHVVWYVCLTTSQAEEAAQRYKGRGAVLKGRTNGLDDKNKSPPCVRAEVVRDAMKAGVHDIARAFCKGQDEKGNEQICPYRQGCAYWTQFDDVMGADVVFLSVEYLFISVSEQLIGRPSVLVIDESPLNSLIATAAPIQVEELRRSPGEAGQVIREIIDAFEKDLDPRRVLRDRFANVWDDDSTDCDAKARKPWTATGLRRMAADLDDRGQHGIHPGMNDRHVRAKLKSLGRGHAAAVLRHIAAEMPTTNKQGESNKPWLLSRQLRGAYYEPKARFKLEGGNKWIEAPGVFLQGRRKLCIAADVPMLVLDGTAEPRLLQAVWPNIEAIYCEAKRNASVVQIVGRSMASSSFDDATPGRNS